MTEQEKMIELIKKLPIDKHSDSYDVGRMLRGVLSEEERRDVRVSDGASKICIVFKKKDFVVKWSTRDFGEAMKEVEIYQKAQEANLAKFFPRTAFLFQHNGVDFVVQEKIDTACADIDGEEIKRIRRITKTAQNRIVAKIEREFDRACHGSCNRSLNHDWAKLAIVLYGKAACKSLCEFVVEHRINDLHGNNIGYKNHRPIILDFSGYHRSDW